MKPKAFVLALAFCLVTAAGCFAQGLHMGTWKLNEAKSKLSPGTTKNHTVVYEQAGDSIKVIVDGTDSAGTAIHHEWTGKFDGKYYPVTGDPGSDERSYRRIGARTLSLSGKKDGKVTITGRIVVTSNGKSRTISTTGTDSTGKKFHNIAYYDKQ